MPTFHWFGMLLPKQKFSINGWRLNHGRQRQNSWTSKLAGEDFMLWSVRKDMNVGRFRNTLPLAQKPTSKCLMLLQTKMKILNYLVLIGTTLSASKTEKQ